MFETDNLIKGPNLRSFSLEQGRRPGKDQKTHRVGFVFTGRIGKLIRRAQALTHVMGFLF